MSRRVHLSEDLVSGLPVLGAGAVVVLFSVLLVAWAWLIHDVETVELGSPQVMAPREAGATISGVRQTLILEERPGRRLVHQQRQQLESFGWVDKRAGFVHIPIEAAMQQLAGGTQ